MATHTNQNQLIAPSKGEIILYQTADGRTTIDVKLENETVWLSSEQMALLFERDRTVIQRHIRNIYSEGELTRETTCAKFAHMGRDGDQTYAKTKFFPKSFNGKFYIYASGKFNRRLESFLSQSLVFIIHKVRKINPQSPVFYIFALRHRIWIYYEDKESFLRDGSR